MGFDRSGFLDGVLTTLKIMRAHAASAQAISAVLKRYPQVVSRYLDAIRPDPEPVTYHHGIQCVRYSPPGPDCEYQPSACEWMVPQATHFPPEKLAPRRRPELCPQAGNDPCVYPRCDCRV